MPVLQQTPAINYTGNGSVTVFAYPFQILTSADLKVYVGGVLVTTGYTVSGVGDASGGSVTFSVAPGTGLQVRFVRVTDIYRSTDYIEGGSIPAATLDADFDRAIMIIQEIDLTAIKENALGQIDFEGRVASNVGTPVSANDAVTKAYVDSTLPTAVSNAAASAAAALASANDSAASASDSYDAAVAAFGYSQDALANSALITSVTGSMILPKGTTAQRDGTPVKGYIRFNETLNQFEGWNGTAWGAIGSGATGGAGNYSFFENDITVSADYTITTNKNAMSAGPITIANGVSVTIPNGSVWSIV